MTPGDPIRGCLSAPDGRVRHRSVPQGTVLAQRDRAVEVRLESGLLHPDDARRIGQWMIDAADVAEGKTDA